MKTLHIDIETSPTLAYVWGLFKQTVRLPQIVEPSRLLCASYAWGDDGPTEFVAEWHKGGARGMVKTLHKVVSEADALVHYNGKTFDTPHVFREFLEHGFGPPAPFQQVDLYQAVKRNFRFTSGKLEFVAEALELGGTGKGASNMQLWTRVLENDADAREEMEAYNRQDVVLLQELYGKIRAWIPAHPNAGLYMAQDGAQRCITCGSERLVKDGHSYTSAGAFQRYRCRECGAWMRDAKRDGTTPLRQATLS